MTANLALQNPFVGLRPFESRDSLYYFGRKQQTYALLKQLHDNRFVAVVGSSGSGKSSLVRAGLIPDLEAGFLVQDRDLWRIATFKPGVTPLYNLAMAVASATGANEMPEAIGDMLKMMERQGAQVLVERAQATLDREDSNLLIVVDQFEELFRFQQARTTQVREEAADFVAILLNLVGQSAAPIYVVLTMRSDFLGDCDAFQGLPEAMNRSQYLVPRLTRHQRREAILGPIRLAGADITPRLMDRLLNESLDTRDDLPVLQHALLRTWSVWRQDGRGPIDLVHYEKAGTLHHALSLHADEALKGLDAERLKIAKRMFQALTETDAANRRIRRPAQLLDIAALCGGKVPPERVMSLIQRFNEDNRNFLVLSSRTAADPLIDISHESLIRQWKTLAGWVDEEVESARIYRRLAESAELHADGKAGLYKETDLQVALDWQRLQQPNAQWAARYHPNFHLAEDFLDRSIRKQKTNKLFIISLLVCVYFCGYFWMMIATTDDVSLATNSVTLPVFGTRMPAGLSYFVAPLILISVYAWFLLHLQRLLWLLSSQPAASGEGRSWTSRLEQTGLQSLAWLTVPAAIVGLWLRYLPRRDETVTWFHLFFLALCFFMAVLLFQSRRANAAGGSAPKQQVKLSGVLSVLALTGLLWILSIGAIKGTPARNFQREEPPSGTNAPPRPQHEYCMKRWEGDFRALVPWIFHELGYDVFLNFMEREVSQLPQVYWQIPSDADRLKVIKGAPLRKEDLRYADMYQAFLAKANLRNSELRGARLREADFRGADLRGADLECADMRQGNFHGADFREADLVRVNLGDADLRNAQLGLADLRGSDFDAARLSGADLRCADLRNAINLPIERLATVKSLYRAQMDEDIHNALTKENKAIFNKPPDPWHDMTTPDNITKKDICQ